MVQSEVFDLLVNLVWNIEKYKIIRYRKLESNTFQKSQYTNHIPLVINLTFLTGNLHTEF